LGTAVISREALIGMRVGRTERRRGYSPYMAQEKKRKPRRSVGTPNPAGRGPEWGALSWTKNTAASTSRAIRAFFKSWMEENGEPAGSGTVEPEEWPKK